MHKKVISIAKNTWADSLYRNSFWLMAGSFSMAGIGFFYWIIAARLYTPEAIGLTTTFFSAMTLVMSLAMLGVGTSLVRFLPGSQQKDNKVNTAFTLVGLVSLALGSIYLFGIPWWSDKLTFLVSNPGLAILLAMFFPVNSINALTDNVFVAMKQSHWVFASNLTQSLTKLLVLVLLPAWGVWGVMGSFLAGVLTATALSLVLIAKRFQIKFRPKIDKQIVNSIKGFSIGNYLASTIGSIPGYLLPMFITHYISPEATAYYYMPSMIAGILNYIPSTISRSYFSESANKNVALDIKKPILVSYLVLVPIVAVMVVADRWILGWFGKSYAEEGFMYLNLACASVLLSVINYFKGTRLIVNNKVKSVIMLNCITAVVYLGGIWLLKDNGIVGIGVAGIITQVISMIIMLYLK